MEQDTFTIPLLQNSEKSEGGIKLKITLKKVALFSSGENSSLGEKRATFFFSGNQIPVTIFGNLFDFYVWEASWVLARTSRCRLKFIKSRFANLSWPLHRRGSCKICLLRNVLCVERFTIPWALYMESLLYERVRMLYIKFHNLRKCRHGEMSLSLSLWRYYTANRDPLTSASTVQRWSWH